MKIGIFSDTHSKVQRAKESLDLLIENGAEFIIHAGDVCELETLELLKNCSKRYICVYGNNDAHLAQYHNKFNLVQEPHYFKLAETKFKLMHLPFYMNPDTEVVLFGHTHEFHCEFIEGTLFLNPGESCARNKPFSECVLLDVQETKFEVTYFKKAIKNKTESEFKVKTLSFNRKIS